MYVLVLVLVAGTFAFRNFALQNRVPQCLYRYVVVSVWTSVGGRERAWHRAQLLLNFWSD